ncbi:ParA family protein [Haliovirga abyssi]|uniref:Sporulation initiation inhibitor Soj n=1 Tax=Haliovirga abyssi TaxID=2996794 RepID=A0AAU9DIS2_9FUSO|nr:ParA family protein [Haliovirga abyssi]BDU51502.1 sporulation initiation inhibitor Soj [Haliovirga abyssi]
MKVIAVVNQKGGVAKTTSTQNIGVGLAKLGKKVLLIDFDPQGNLTSGFGIDKRDLNYTVYDILKTRAFPGPEISVEKVLLEKDNISILPTNIKMSKINIELGGVPGKDNILKEILKEIYGFDYILIDCPPSLDTLTFNALTAADAVYIPVQAEYYALEGISELMDTIDMVKQRLNENLKIAGVFATMLDKRVKLHLEVIKELKKFFGEVMFKTLIRRNVKVSEASSYGKSIFDYDEKSHGAQDYLNLCKEIVEREVN